MFFNHKKEADLEQQSAKHELSMQELMIRIDSLDREVKTLLDELQITPEQVSHFVSSATNFTSENWEELQNQRKLLDEKLAMELSNIKNPTKTKEALQSQKNVARHWIFVR